MATFVQDEKDVNANIVADNSNDVLSVEVNGENSKNIRWSALVKVVIVKQT